MDKPAIDKASNITKISFVANWQSVAGADKYYLDVSENADFSTFLTGYEAKEVADNYDEVAGLSDLSHYFYRVKAEDNPDTGTAELGTLSSLTDTDKAWTADQFVGMLVRITAGTGAGQEVEITANTADTLTAAFATAPDATSVYEIADISEYSFVMEVVTGFHVAGMSIEFGNLVADLFNIQGITIEVSTDFNFQAIIRNNEDVKVNSARCIIIRDDWSNKGTYDPAGAVEESGTAESGTTTALNDTDKAWTADQFVGMYIRISSGTGAGQEVEITANTADTLTASFTTAPDATSVYEIIEYRPDSTPSEGDYYTIATAGESYVTGELEEFNPTDLLVYLDAAWQIKKRRLIYSDLSGVANMNIDYLVDNLFVVSKSGYETERQTINYVAGYHQYDIRLFPQKSVIHHKSGHAINMRPEERQNKFFE